MCIVVNVRKRERNNSGAFRDVCFKTSRNVSVANKMFSLSLNPFLGALSLQQVTSQDARKADVGRHFYPILTKSGRYLGSLADHCSVKCRGILCIELRFTRRKTLTL